MLTAEEVREQARQRAAWWETEAFECDAIGCSGAARYCRRTAAMIRAVFLESQTDDPR